MEIIIAIVFCLLIVVGLIVTIAPAVRRELNNIDSLTHMIDLEDQFEAIVKESK